MAAACLGCNVLRFSLDLNCRSYTRFLRRKWKFVNSAISFSSFSLISFRDSFENHTFSRIVCSGAIPSFKSENVSHKDSGHLRSSVCLLTRKLSSIPEGKKSEPKKIKAKFEQMKEMVNYIQIVSNNDNNKEDIFTVPNLLSTLRILSTPVLGYWIMSEEFVKAIFLFAAAGVSDMLDGFIARNFKNQRSILGTILDPLADKILMSTLTVSLSVVSLLPVPLTMLILSRDALLVSCAFYFRFKSLPSPKTISRYFDMNLPTVELRPNLLGKVNTVLQLALVGCSLFAPVFGFVDHPHLQYFWYIVAGSTLLSSVSYVISFKGSVKYLK